MDVVSNQAHLDALDNIVRQDGVDPFLSRDISLLQFHHRVLQMAMREDIPVLERLKFLAISSSNLDEFFETRYARLLEKIDLGLNKKGIDGLTTVETLERVNAFTRAMVSEQYRFYNTELIPQLAKKGIHLLQRKDWSEETHLWVSELFRQDVYPVLSPIALDPAHPFPKVQNKSLNYVVRLEGTDDFGRSNEIAIVRIPRSLPRVIRIKRKEQEHEYVLLSSIVRANIDQLFPGMRVLGAWPFRVTRDSDIGVTDEDVDDLLKAYKGQLHHRSYGEPVRLEIAADCQPEVIEHLLSEFDLAPSRVFKVNGPVNLHRLMELYAATEPHADLRDKVFLPRLNKKIEGRSIFEAIDHGDIFVHRPFQSFTHVIDWLNHAADDPDVLAIKMTLYRTASNSDVVEALKRAARQGKEVTAVIEIKARFDEAANIDFAAQLQESGANVSYGLMGYKTHAKMIHIVRRTKGKLKGYVHLSTGNYHKGTALHYTDLSLFTAEQSIADEIHMAFGCLTGQQSMPPMNHVWLSPLNIHPQLLKKIDRERERAEKGKPARIVIKCNSLIEPKIIKALYKASQAGVDIDLIIRGMCRLKPGVKGLSENIRVFSVLGRYLEHSRVFAFGVEDKMSIWLSSADVMERNMFKRFEHMVPILDKKIRKRIMRECIDVYLSAPTDCWQLDALGRYHRDESVSIKQNPQRRLMKHFQNSEAKVAKKKSRAKKRS